MNSYKECSLDIWPSSQSFQHWNVKGIRANFTCLSRWNIFSPLRTSQWHFQRWSEVFPLIGKSVLVHTDRHIPTNVFCLRWRTTYADCPPDTWKMMVLYYRFSFLLNAMACDLEQTFVVNVWSKARFDQVNKALEKNKLTVFMGMTDPLFMSLKAKN